MPPLYYSAFGILRYIFVTSRTRPLRYPIHSRSPRFLGYTQKSGTAILLFRDSRLWYCLQFQTTTLKPTPYVLNARIVRVHYLHTYGHLSAAMFWNFIEFTRFRTAKTKRVRRLLLCPVSLPQQGTYPRRELKNFRSHAVWNGIRLQNYTKKMTLANKSAIFCIFVRLMVSFMCRSRVY